MTLINELQQRAGHCCELCGADKNLDIYLLPPDTRETADQAILACDVCRDQITQKAPWRPEHWRDLSETMWSPVPAVQVMAWRILNSLPDAPWAMELLDTLYLEDDVLAWAKSGLPKSTENDCRHRDNHGAPLAAGDNVVLTKDLNVKGANFTAKRGTVVRGISLSADNPEHIEGKVNGQRIVILTLFVKKAK